MSVVADFPVIQRPWAGYDDPGLPVGMWIAQGTVSGDMTGGDASVVFVFKPAGNPLGGRFYNIEQLEVHTTNASVNEGGLLFNNFEIVGTTGLVNRLTHLSLESDGITDAGLIPGDLQLPIFIGRPQLVDLEAAVQVRLANTTIEVLFATIQGYIWEPRSLLVAGGLRRPPDSLYGG